jgi:hypothetical protein
MTNDKSILQAYKSMKEPVDITCSNGDSLPAYGEGTLKINASPPITINGVLFVPGITKTLLATKSFTKQGLTVVIDDQLKIKDKQGRTMIVAHEENDLYYIIDHGFRECNSSITLEQAHRRFGHASDERLRYLSDSAVGVEISNKERDFCEICAHAKSRKQPFPEERRTKPTRAFEIVSLNTSSPLTAYIQLGHGLSFLSTTAPKKC